MRGIFFPVQVNHQSRHSRKNPRAIEPFAKRFATFCHTQINCNMRGEQRRRNAKGDVSGNMVRRMVRNQQKGTLSASVDYMGRRYHHKSIAGAGA